jgi:hypothetical protein
MEEMIMIRDALECLNPDNGTAEIARDILVARIERRMKEVTRV